MNWKQAFAVGLIAPGMYASERWETVFEGEITTTKNNNFSRTNALTVFVGGDTVRFTVNGSSEIVTAQQDGIFALFGNEGLLGDYLEDYLEDTGGDYYVASFEIISGYPEIEIYTRNPGTYIVKIERKL